MSDHVKKNPLFRQGWLRVLLFGCSFFIVTLLLAIPTVLAIGGITVRQLKDNFIPTLTGLFTGNYLWLLVVVEFAISLITVCVFRLIIDRRSFISLGWDLEGFVGEGLTGLLLGPALAGLTALLLLFSGHLEWTDITWDPNALFISIGLMLLIAFSEELVFRGYILGNLLETFPNKYIALAASAFLFACFHIPDPGIHTLAFTNVFLCGLLLGINYIYTKNCWFSFLFHFSFNFFQGPVLGFKVSGISLPSLLQAEPKGDLFLTGGDFGLEGSILNTLISLTSVLILAWAFEKKYNPSSPPPAKTSPSKAG